MLVREMSNEECVRVFAGARLARLACAVDNQPYVVPVYLAFYQSSIDEPCFYGFTTLGQKIEWMRANPLVCVEMDEIVSTTRWRSVIAFGRFQELPLLPELNAGHRPARLMDHDPNEVVHEESVPTCEALVAYQLLQTHAMWWEPASTSRVGLAHDNSVQSFDPIYFKISIDRTTGREATPDIGAKSLPESTSHPSGKFHWLRDALDRVIPR
jgi:nitroimidazol reductase NimA-like FMN-containing flavoprotein (pyridoxamine 5'-phosphate oxidase superfamily)